MLSLRGREATAAIDGRIKDWTYRYPQIQQKRRPADKPRDDVVS